MWATVGDLNLPAFQLLAQTTGAQKKAMLAKDKVAEARQEAMTAKDVAAATMDEAQEISLQAGFKVLCQVLLQLKPGFNIKSLDALVTIEIVAAAILEAEAECKANQEDLTSQGGGVEEVLGTTIEGTEAVKATPTAEDIEATEAMPIEEDAEVANMALVEEDVEPIEKSHREATS